MKTISVVLLAVGLAGCSRPQIIFDSNEARALNRDLANDLIEQCLRAGGSVAHITETVERPSGFSKIPAMEFRIACWPPKPAEGAAK